MNEQQYRTVIGWFNARPAAKKALRAVSTGSAVAAFVVGTALRAAINRPRPYTKYGFVPLFPKDKTGQSMPSRHCFSAAAMAAAEKQWRCGTCCRRWGQCWRFWPSS